MKMKKRNWIALPVVFSLCLSCGGETTDTSASKTITIGTGSAFTTTTLNASAGDTITVTNNDSTTHTVTSESAVDKFDKSGSFDTGNISAGGGTKTFTIPTTASIGDKLFYYCDLHKGTMTPTSGTITIVAK